MGRLFTDSERYGKSGSYLKTFFLKPDKDLRTGADESQKTEKQP